MSFCARSRRYPSWVKTNIGKSPAILGVDMMDYSPSRVAYGTTSNEVENAIAHHNNGGIVTFVWHWNAPSGLYNSASQRAYSNIPPHNCILTLFLIAWYSGFYSTASSFNLGTALSNTNGNDYKLIIRDIDAIATQLKRLQSAGVPILWRPLHEAEGGWVCHAPFHRTNTLLTQLYTVLVGTQRRLYIVQEVMGHYVRSDDQLSWAE